MGCPSLRRPRRPLHGSHESGMFSPATAGRRSSGRGCQLCCGSASFCKPCRSFARDCELWVTVRCRALGRYATTRTTIIRQYTHEGRAIKALRWGRPWYHQRFSVNLMPPFSRSLPRESATAADSSERVNEGRIFATNESSLRRYVVNDWPGPASSSNYAVKASVFCFAYQVFTFVRLVARFRICTVGGG